MKLRKATKKDIINLRKLILFCIKKQFNNYSKEKVNAMENYSSEERLKKYLKDWEVFVFIDRGKILGTISLEEKKVVFSLYAINSLIRRKLITFIEKDCLKNKSKKITAIVMPENKKDFQSKGFKVIEKIVLPFKSVKFKEFKMEKKLK
jgi:hypothetical protein